MSINNVKIVPRGMKTLYALGTKRAIDLSLSENPLGCSPRISLVLQKCKLHFNDYPTPNANNLKTAMAEKVGCKKENIFVCNGSEAIINVIPRIFARPDDEAIIPALTFPMFSICSDLAGLTVTLAPMTNELSISLNAMTKLVSRNTQLIFICNPNNPTGSVISKSELTAFIRFVPAQIITVVDEANIEFGGESVAELIRTQSNLIVLRTFSKGFGLANARIGIAIADKSLITRLEEENPVFPVSGLGEEMAIAALQDDAFIVKTKLFIEMERERIRKSLVRSGFKVFSSEANNLFVKLPDQLDQETFLNAMEKASISLVNGSSFAGFDDSFFRVSPRSEKINDAFLTAINKLNTR